MSEFLFFSSLLAFLSFFSSTVSACGAHEEEAYITGNAIYGGFMGGNFISGVVFAFLVIAVILGIMVLIRRNN